MHCVYNFDVREAVQLQQGTIGRSLLLRDPGASRMSSTAGTGDARNTFRPKPRVLFAVHVLAPAGLALRIIYDAISWHNFADRIYDLEILAEDRGIAGLRRSARSTVGVDWRVINSATA